MLLSTLRIVQTHIVRRKQQNTLFHWPLNWGSLALAVYFLCTVNRAFAGITQAGLPEVLSEVTTVK